MMKKGGRDDDSGKSDSPTMCSSTPTTSKKKKISNKESKKLYTDRSSTTKKKRRKILVENSTDNSMMTKGGRDDDSGKSDSPTMCSSTPTTSKKKKITNKELKKLYTDRIDVSRELILEDELTKLESLLLKSKNETKELRTEREDHLQKMAELEEQNIDLLLELASLKLSGGGDSDCISFGSNKNNDRRRRSGGSDNGIRNGTVSRRKPAVNDVPQSPSVRGVSRRASVCVVRHDDNINQDRASASKNSRKTIGRGSHDESRHNSKNICVVRLGYNNLDGTSDHSRNSLSRTSHDSRHNPKKIATRRRISASCKDYILGYTTDFIG
jgi:hypothetical protein